MKLTGRCQSKIFNEIRWSLVALALFAANPSEGLSCIICTYDEMASPDQPCLLGSAGLTGQACSGSEKLCHTEVQLPSQNNGGIKIIRGCSNKTEGNPAFCTELKSSHDAVKNNQHYDCHCSSDNCNNDSPFKQSTCYTCTYKDSVNGSASNEQCLEGGTALPKVTCPPRIREGPMLCVKASGIEVGPGYVRVVQRECTSVKHSLGCHNAREFQASDTNNSATPLRNVLACFCADELCNGNKGWMPQRPKTKGSVGRLAPFSSIPALFILLLQLS